jgi:hypothetical protein
VGRFSWGDGDVVVYARGSSLWRTTSSFRHDILLIPTNSSLPPRPLANEPSDELFPSFSPDGRWMAYGNSATGRQEVFVARTDDPSTRVQLTNDNSVEPTWMPDGKTVVVRNGSNFIARSLSFTPGIEVSRRDTLFADVYRRGNPDRGYDVNPKTGEFVTLARAGSRRDRIVVVTGWLDELRARFAQAR